MKPGGDARYVNVQKGPVHLILLGAAAVIAAFWVALDIPLVGFPSALLAMLSVLFLTLAFSFRTLTTSDEGDHLRVRFGPLPVFTQRVAYERISSVERSRSDFLDGFGIHYLPRRGWIWNLWGFDCVRVHFHTGGPLRIGTNDPEGLVRHLQGKITA